MNNKMGKKGQRNEKRRGFPGMIEDRDHAHCTSAILLNAHYTITRGRATAYGCLLAGGGGLGGLKKKKHSVAWEQWGKHSPSTRRCEERGGDVEVNRDREGAGCR